MKQSEKPFDAVQMMRQIRDKLSEQIKDMNFEVQKRYMRERLARAWPIGASDTARTERSEDVK